MNQGGNHCLSTRNAIMSASWMWFLYSMPHLFLLNVSSEKPPKLHFKQEADSICSLV